MDNADTSYDKLWSQILATTFGYGVFIAVLMVIFLVRKFWLV